jgi:hypothetical protein
MPEDRWDPLRDVLQTPDADEYGTNDVPPPPAENLQAVPKEERPKTPSPEQRNMTGGAVLPNNAQELAEDEVEESDIESFPASDAPAW